MSERSRAQVLDALVDICGPDYARAGRSVDVVGDRRVAFVAMPATNRALADTLRLAADHGLHARPRGSGSKIDWGAPDDGADLLIDTRRLSGMWHHDVAGGTAEVGAGTPVRALQAALALRGQRLAVDPPSRTATVGGMLAVNESGPLRHRFGAPAEHVDRVSFVDPAGKVAESDGEDGRPGIADIAGVLTSALVRLVPLPAARRWVTVPVTAPLHLPELIGPATEEEPSAIEVDLPAGGLAVLFEGPAGEATARAERLAARWGADAEVIGSAPLWWGHYPFERGDVALRVSVSPDDLPAALYALGDAAGGPVPVRGSAGLGSVHAVLRGDLGPERVGRILQSLEHVLMARHGRAVVVAAPPGLARRIDMADPRELF